ncbi:MAG: hypothetical protein DI635_00790 [Pseudoxanthomonas suwonensis]|nr:MAG: hypothetical protein DI635_00790 [Pseudoxanthomonas suwonensis]
MIEAVFAGVHEELFELFGVDGHVRRGLDDPVPVRLVIARGVETLGEYGQVVARVTTADFLVRQWQPKQADVVTWTDDHGMHTKRVDSVDDDDGYVARTVLHG